MGGKSGGVAGYRYYLGLHFGLCHALAQLGPSPVLLLHFDGANGDVVTVDSSVNAFPVTMAGDATLSSAHPAFGPTALNLPDTSTTAGHQFVTVPIVAGDPIDVLSGSGDFTIDGLFYLEPGHPGTALCIMDYGNDHSGGGFGANDHGFVLFATYNVFQIITAVPGGSGTWGGITDAVAISAGAWHSFAVVRQSGTMTLYLDGAALAGAPVWAGYTLGGAYGGFVNIGNSFTFNGGICPGQVDEIRVFRSAVIPTPNADGLLEIRAGDRTAWAGLQHGNGTVSIQAPTLFGGDQKEGGIQGELDVLFGDPAQGVNPYLLAKQGNPQSGHRGVTSVVYKGGLIGANNPYPKPWSFRLRRTVSGWFGNAPWYPETAAVTLSSGVIGMNPAHIVYETLTNPDWGMGYPGAALDDAAFRATALALFNEGFGINMLWNRQDTIESFLQKIVDYIAGVVVTSPVTGLFQLKLIRGDYTIGSLPVFTAADVLEVVDKEDAAITNGVNEMWIKFFDPISKQTQSVALQALGSVQSQGVVISDNKTFTGIATADLAARVCQRELRATTVPLKRFQFKGKRTFYKLTPGDVFVMNFPAIGLSSVVFRMGEIDTGTLLDGSIAITSVEDVFSMPSDTYIAVQTSGWTPPNNNPVVAVNYVGYEADFRTVYKLLGAGTANALPPAVGYCGALLARPDPLCQSYGVYTVVGGGAYVGHATAHFAPTGVLAGSIGVFGTAMTINTMIDTSEVALGTACLIVDTVPELVRIDAINATTGVCTIGRGCVDTVANPHTTGARVYFLDGFLGSDGIEYTVGETVHNKDCPNAPLGQLDISLAPVIDVTIAGRALLPYPPALPKINGTRFDLATAPTGPFTLSWFERNRLTQADVLVDQTAATVTPESGTTYTIRVIDTAGPTLLRTFTGLTATSQLINAGASAALVIELEAVRGGLTSLQHWAIPVTFTSGSVAMTDESGVALTDESGVPIFSE
jgi:Concanavalin A-like lectin/glucanases superfamily/Putative phage tail protein